MAYSIRDAYNRAYPVGAIMRIGRDPANQLVLNDPLVSNCHATLWEQQGYLILRDENSANGTLVNHGRIQGGVYLHPGDQVTIGNTTFIVDQWAASQPQVPPQQPAYPPPQSGFVPPQPGYVPAGPLPMRKSIGCGRWILLGLLLASVGCLAACVGGFLLYRSGSLTPAVVMKLIGIGPAGIQVDNFQDGVVMVSILQLEVSTDTSPAKADWVVNSFDIRTFSAQNAGRYQVDFGTSSGSSDLGTCMLTLKAGDQYHFVMLPDKIVVNRANYKPAKGTDLIVATSTLCR